MNRWVGRWVGERWAYHFLVDVVEAELEGNDLLEGVGINHGHGRHGRVGLAPSGLGWLGG